jgi:demethylmenaquinone methyltransferase/2-methoxy-6-polyprenyl-1,4-benzoquinol methylase
MFDTIAPAYDFMNRAMTFGIDKWWRRRAVRVVQRTKPGDIVDLATGTGDLAISLARHIPAARIKGIDLSAGMVEIGREKVRNAGLDSRVTLSVGDCLDLPLDDASADAITIAYGVRNFAHLDKGYSEMLRVLRPGGMLCVIELSTPPNRLARWFYNLYTRYVIPSVGRIISKDVRAYSYLPESIAAVPQGSDMLQLMADAGFCNTRFRRMTFGTCTIYTAHRPI